jgi:hypothetical protein
MHPRWTLVTNGEGGFPRTSARQNSQIATSALLAGNWLIEAPGECDTSIGIV